MALVCDAGVGGVVGVSSLNIIQYTIGFTSSAGSVRDQVLAWKRGKKSFNHHFQAHLPSLAEQHKLLPLHTKLINFKVLPED